MRLVLRTHPADATLLEVMLEDEQGREKRVARAPLANPRAWEWTTPPSWLRRESVEGLLDEAADVTEIAQAMARDAQNNVLGALSVEGQFGAVEVDGPRLPGVKALQKVQETALATMHDSLTLCTVGPTGVIE